MIVAAVGLVLVAAGALVVTAMSMGGQEFVFPVLAVDALLVWASWRLARLGVRSLRRAGA
jgi:hypothetical protein